MKTEAQKSFEKDILSLTDKKLAQKVLSLLHEIERCKTLSEIHHLKKMKGAGNYFRIRVGNYRLGLKLEKEVVVLLRFMHRQDIYKYFP